MVAHSSVVIPQALNRKAKYMTVGELHPVDDVFLRLLHHS
jgi:hypothetical protein